MIGSNDSEPVRALSQRESSIDSGPKRHRRLMGAITAGILLAGGGAAATYERASSPGEHVTSIGFDDLVKSPEDYTDQQIVVGGYVNHEGTLTHNELSNYVFGNGNVGLNSRKVVEVTYKFYESADENGPAIKVINKFDDGTMHIAVSPDPVVTVYSGEVQISGKLVAEKDEQGHETYILDAALIEELPVNSRAS